MVQIVKIQNSVPSIRLHLHMSPPFWGTGFNDPFTLPAEYGHEISGGGFRNVFPRPSYQNDVVERYLNPGPHIPPISYFNPNGRGFPDISAVCYYSLDKRLLFWTVENLYLKTVYGTSASTPTVAGIISLLNDARLQNNKSALGFLNPFLYQNPATLYMLPLDTMKDVYLGILVLC